MTTSRLEIILILFILLTPIILFSQKKNLVVNKIEFEGLKKTKSDYLFRFLDTPIQEAIALEEIEKDVQRLRNLPTISQATYQIDTIESKLNLTIKIEEASTLFPIINFGGVKGNFWYQVGFNDTHWLGRGYQLSGFYQNIDRRHNGNLYLRAPFFRGGKLGFSASLLRYASTEPVYISDQSVYFDYTNSSIALSGIYQINRTQSFELGGSYFTEDYQKDKRHDGEATRGPESFQQPKTLGKAIHRIDKINYHFFYLFGFENISNFQTVYNLDEQTLFHIFLNETRYFKRIKRKGNLAARLRIGVSTNTDSPFAPFVLDSHINIRGSGNRIDRGTAALIFNLEYRHTVYDKKRIAAQVVGFSDIGNWRTPGGDLSELTTTQNFRHFLGGGIRVINKKAFNSMLRIDYGVDIYNFNEKGLVIGVGQYF